MSGDLADLNFDARTETASSGFDPIPKGEYVVQVTKAQKKPTKANNGHYLELTCQVINGPYQNRIVFAKFNLWNPSAEAVRIARGQYKDFCNAIGNPTPRDTSELVNAVLTISVTVKNDSGFGMTNDVRGFKPRHAQAAAPQVGPAPSAPQNPQLMTGQAAPQQDPTVPANPFG